MKDCRNKISMSIQEAKDLLNIKADREKNRNIWIGIGIGVLIVLVALIIWLATKNSKDIEEHYEYFDDYDDYDDMDNLDDEENEDIEYVKLRNFMDDDKEASDEKLKKKTDEDKGQDNVEDYYTSSERSSVYDPEIDDIEGVGAGKYDSRNYTTDSYNEDIFETDEEKQSDESNDDEDDEKVDKKK